MRRFPKGELEFLRDLRTRVGPSSTSALRLGIGDDAAILRPPRGHEIVVTTDFSLEGRHFRRDWGPPQAAGHRCLARGLSDLAAMGAKPIAAFLSLALPPDLRSTIAGRTWLDGFLNGLLALARATNTPLAGGDTASAPGPAILADIVLVGAVPTGKALLRSGAKPGDAIYVTGSLGGAAAELAAITRNPRTFRKASPADPHPHLFPQPRLAIGQALLRRGLASAAMDLSDGLSTDLPRLCAESRVGAIIDAAQLPLHPLLQNTEQALNGGEDYELLFTAPASTPMPTRIAGIPITRIGTITPARRGILILKDNKAQPLQPAGWEHAL